MRKGTRIFKKYIATFLIVLMSINSFGAVVSDNDGSAFITKAEFDSLKNNFQSQIDKYNTSIDSKIDGAIASYLSGISVARTTQLSTLCYDGAGIISVRAGEADIPWVEGMIYYEMLTYWHWDNPWSGYEATSIALHELKSKPALPFSEAAIINIDRTNGFAIWSGHSSTTYTIRGVGWDNNWGYQKNMADGGTPNKWLSWNDGFYTRSNIDLANFHDMALKPSLVDSKALKTSNHLHTYWDWSTIARKVNRASYSNIILCPESASYTRFVDYDEYRDFQNDTSLTGHSRLTKMSDYWASASSKFFGHYDSGAKVHGAQLLYADWDGTWTPPNTINYYRPFFGFVSAINNWNQLATTKYDAIVENLKIYNTSLTTYKDARNVEHLFIQTGAPIVEVKKDDIIKIEIMFEDDAKDYDVWFSLNGWNAGEAVDTGVNVINRDNITRNFSGSESCYNGSYGSKSAKIRNGRGTLYVKAEGKGYLFMKWSLSGNSGAGGGTWMPPKTVDVTSS